MPMCFDSSVKVNNFLVGQWNSTTLSELLLMGAFTFAIAVLMELVRIVDGELSRIAQGNLCNRGNLSGSSNASVTTPLLASSSNGIGVTSSSSRSNQQPCGQHRFALHVARTIVRTLSYGTGNILMLAIMCYNIWVLLICCIGHAFGHLIAAVITRSRLRSRIRDFSKRVARDDVWPTGSSR